MANQEDHSDQVAKNWPAMAASADFKAATERYASCMLAAGYPQTDQRIGVVLKDGTIVKPEAGSRFELSGAYLDYRVSSETCDETSGMNAVRAQYQTADPTPDPERVRRTNANTIKEMGCMEAKGWDIPEPKTSRGLMIFDVAFGSEDEHTSYVLDYYRCQNELGTVETIK